VGEVDTYEICGDGYFWAKEERQLKTVLGVEGVVPLAHHLMDPFSHELHVPRTAARTTMSLWQWHV
jgi:hypothetical protein